MSIGATALPATGLAGGSADFTITDNDTGSTALEVALSSDSALESAGTATVDVTVSLDAGTRTTATNVTLTVLEGTATSPADYSVASSPFTLTIPAGMTSVSQAVPIVIVDDNIAEGEELLSIGAEATGLTSDSEAFTITDNDTAPTSIALSVSPSSVAEDVGTAPVVTVTATVSGSSRFSEAQTVAVTVGDAGDSATEGTDYETVGALSITIAAGADTGMATFTLTPIQDVLSEGPETLTVSGSAAVTVTATELTITDDDAAPTLPTSITLSVSPSSVAENAARSVTVTARVDERGRFPQAQMVTATVGKSGDSAVEGTDYMTVNNVTITIDANAVSGTGTFTLTPMNDSVYEGSETISVEGSVAGSVAGSAVTVTPAMITITDNDTESTALVLTLDPNRAKENAGTVDVEVEVRLDADARPMSTPVTISIMNGTASSSDYSVSESTVSLEIPAGMTEVTEMIEFDIANDNVTEEDKTVTLEASTTGTSLASNSENFTIEDDDAPSTALVLTLDPNSVKQDAGTVDVEVEVSLDGAPRATPTPVAISITDGTAGSSDYSVSESTFSLEIPAGMTEVTERVEFDITNDNVTEDDETVVIEATAMGTSLTGDSKNFTIEEDDATSTALVLTLDPARLHEDSGTSWVRFTAGLDGATRTMDTPVEVRVTAGTAIENADYRTPVVPTSLIISSGETSLRDSLQMVITDNDTMEGNKTVVIEVSATDLNAATQELVIVDDESGVRVDTLMAEVNATGGYTITTPVRQNMGAPVTSVVLHYGDGMTFEMTPMEMSSEGSYTAELMAPAEGGILYYYILATNEDGLTTTYPPEGRYQDISDYTEGSRLVLLDFENEDAGDKSTVGHAIVYRGGELTFAEDALVLDGMDDHAEILGSSLGASEEFALEIMFNANDFDAAVLDEGGTYLVSKPARCAACWEESTFSLLWERSADSGTLLAARFWNPEYGESGQVELEIPMPLASGQWYHAVLEVQRRDAGQRALLRLRDQSGMLHGEDVAVLPAHPAISTYPIFVGHIGDRGFFDGRIDDVGFYNYAHFGLSLASSEDAWEVPEGYVLEQNYPNPFNPVTTIRYDLAAVGHVRLEVSDLLGRRVALLVDAVQEAGAQEVRFDARDLPSGMYLYRLRVEDFVSVKKMVLLK